jgi:uncharacterized protein GlcG (DUF336 family)
MPDLTFAAADAIRNHVFETARKNGWAVAVAVLDAGANLMQASRMDGCRILGPDIARGKAYASAVFRRSSGDIEHVMQNPALAAGFVGITGNRMVPGRGALPIWDGDRHLGAAGVSGRNSSQEDEDLARAAIEAAGFSVTSSSDGG